jgi:hypothetical protein
MSNLPRHHQRLPRWCETCACLFGEAAYEKICYPIAHRLIELCVAVLRLPGDSKGADEDVRRARERNLPVYTKLENIPPYGR